MTHNISLTFKYSVLIVAAILFSAMTATALVPETLSFQGEISAGQSVSPNSTVTMTFTIYNNPNDNSGLSRIWTETQTVTLRNRQFSVILGSINPINVQNSEQDNYQNLFDEQYWIGVRVGDAAEMRPRVKLTSAPYAFNVHLPLSQIASSDDVPLLNLVNTYGDGGVARFISNSNSDNNVLEVINQTGNGNAIDATGAVHVSGNIEASGTLKIGGGAAMTKLLTATSDLDYSSTSGGTSADLTITVTGAEPGDVVFIGVPDGSVISGTNYTAWVSSSNTVTVRFNNYSSSSADPSSGTFRVTVMKF